MIGTARCGFSFSRNALWCQHNHTGAQMTEAAAQGESEDDPWDAQNARVLESMEVDASVDATNQDDAVDDQNAPWKCGICGRENRPEGSKCTTCTAERGRKPNPKIVNFVSGKEPSRSASSSHRMEDTKVHAKFSPFAQLPKSQPSCHPKSTYPPPHLPPLPDAGTAAAALVAHTVH